MYLEPDLKKHLERQVLLGGHQAQSAIELLQKYSPDQPRDSHGRFGSGGGSSGLGSGGSGNMKEGEGADYNGPKLFPAADKKPLTKASDSNMQLFNHLVADGKGGWKPDSFAEGLRQSAIQKYTGGVPSQDNPRAVMMGGGPASGKSSMLNAGSSGLPSENDPNYVHINADDIKGDIPGYLEALDGRDLEAATNAHEMSSWLAKEVNSQAIVNQQNIVLDGTGNSSESKLIGKIDSYHDAGYTVDGAYVTCPTDVALDRSVARGNETSRYVPEGVVRETHASVSSVVPTAADNFDSFKLYDSTNTSYGDAAPLIAQTTLGNPIQVVDPVAYQQFLDKGNENTSVRTWMNSPTVSYDLAGNATVKFGK